MYYDWSDNERWENKINQDHGRSSRMPLFVLILLAITSAFQPLAHYILI